MAGLEVQIGDLKFKNPAPDSTKIVIPSLQNFLTVSGVAATRASPCIISFGIPIIIAIILSYKCVLYDLISKTQS
jgi:hypothetical protein